MEKQKDALEKFLDSEIFKNFLKEYNYKITDFTCYDCSCKNSCPCSFDFYNTNGDCLEGK